MSCVSGVLSSKPQAHVSLSVLVPAVWVTDEISSNLDGSVCEERGQVLCLGHRLCPNRAASLLE